MSNLKMKFFSEFVRWWDENVTPGRELNRSPRSATSISADKAADQTGYTKQQVSKWRNRLKGPVAS